MSIISIIIFIEFIIVVSVILIKIMLHIVIPMGIASILLRS